MAKKPKNMFELLEGIELIQAQRKRNSTNAKILFGESINGVLKAKNGKGKRTLVYPRDKERSKNPTSVIG